MTMTKTSAGNTPPSGVETLSPWYFAMVMATGIISIAAALHGMTTLSKILFWVNIPLFAILLALTISRLVHFPRGFVADLVSHKKGAAFLTIAAATNILATQLGLLTTSASLAYAMWILGIVLWIVLLYTFLAGIAVKKGIKPSLADGINGAWLLLIVSTESIAVLGATLGPKVSNPRPVLFISLAAYLIGAMLYFVVIGLIFYRWAFFSAKEEDPTPSYWIDMGALAIATVAGANLLTAVPSWPFLESISPFLKATTVLFWAFASWWIPWLFILAAWRYFAQRIEVSYDPAYWNVVFALGAYAAACFNVSLIVSSSTMVKLANFFLWLSLAAWIVVLLAMLAYLASRAVREPDPIKA